MVRKKTSYLLSLFILGAVFISSEYFVWVSYKTGYFENNNYLNVNPQENIETTISQELSPNAKEAVVNIDFGASKVSLSASDRQNILVEGKHISNFSTLEQDQRVKNDESVSTFKSKPLQRLFSGHNVNDLTLFFSEKPEYSFKINTGASSLNLNFVRLAVKDLKVNAGAAKIDLFISNKADFSGKFSLGASNVIIHVPEDANINIKSKVVAVSNNFSDFGLEKKNSQWTSQLGSTGKNISLDFDGAATKIELVKQ